MVQPVVEALLADQLLVVALLDDGAVLDHQNGVGVLDGGKSVGNDKAGLVLHQCRHGVLNLDLRAGVHVGGGFVQNQNGCFGKKSAGDGDQLLLPLGDVYAVVGKHRLVAIGETADVGIDLSGACRRVDLLGSGIFSSVYNVVVNSSAEQPGISEEKSSAWPNGGDFLGLSSHVKPRANVC